MPTLSGHTSAIRAGKVLGTKVLDIAGNKIGEIQDIVLDKQSNNIMFAVVSFGGLLGIGEKFHPIPWSELNYDMGRNGYIVSFDKQQLETAPSDSIDALVKDDGRSFRDQAFRHYKTTPYWQ